ncbi:hypothetical protein JOF41_000022 [Saccharothrix coeruleofusca]|uniref:hypothetical protein n=1 Tax=Saccharothrix coeruleofusca TaxID=33919 RepID=UPI001AEA8316|nr:hypothetical protein [Saccharothrix coeruleofusca]MBP2333844.1 hypothetical protein [Saccharothrix coeruleofusca]
MTTFSSTTATADVLTADLNPRGNPMLLEENLARSRMREAEISAERQRLAHRLVVARRWRRLAGWAERRAALKARAL